MSKKEVRSIKVPPSNFNIHPQLVSFAIISLGKNGKEQFFIYLLTTNEVRQHAPKGPKISFGWGRREGGKVGVLDLFCSHFVINKFPMSSQYVPQVPNVFPNIFPNSSSLYLILKVFQPFSTWLKVDFVQVMKSITYVMDTFVMNLLKP